jgi:hypothetical protein
MAKRNTHQVFWNFPKKNYTTYIRNGESNLTLPLTSMLDKREDTFM